MSSAPSLPQDDDAAGQAARAAELAAQREAYSPWQPMASPDGSPRPMQLAATFSVRKGLVPKAEQFWRTAMAGTAIGTAMGAEMTKARLRALGRPSLPAADGVTSLVDRYRPMFTPAEQADLPLGGRTLDDGGFALQRLYGTSPYQIECVRSLPGHVKVRDADVAAVLPPGATLDGLMREHALFMVDTKPAFEGQLHHRALFSAGLRAAPTTLFFLDPATQALRPCAIQLLPEPVHGQPNPVFTPRAPAGTWLAAKLFANQAESVAHIAGLHTAGVHAFGQTVVAMRRTLSARHPIQAFAEPWTREIIPALAMGQLASSTIPPWKAASGPLGGQYWRTFRLDDYHLRRRVEARGVAHLPVFPWRDNMLDLWDAFERSTRRVVHHIYRDDGALQADPEIQAWAAALHAPDVCHIRASSLEATDGRFSSREQLVDVLTTLHFFLGAWFGYDAFHWTWFAWLPSTPVEFRLKLPIHLDPLPLDTVVGALGDPDSKASREQRAGILAVRQRWAHSRLTTRRPSGLDQLPGAEPHVRAWFADLADLDQRFDARDQAVIAAGHLPAPAATYPSNCSGAIWYP
jgi:hypothetical protein